MNLLHNGLVAQLLPADQGLLLRRCEPVHLTAGEVLAVPERHGLSCLYRQQGVAHQVCVLQTPPDSHLSDNLFAADLLAQRHAAATWVVANHPTEHWLGPLHPWLGEPPA